MRVAVIGAGGVGGYFGARLATGGQEVTFIARGRHLEALRLDGLRVNSVLGDLVVRPVLAADSTSGVGVVDAVLICVKTWQLEQALDLLPPLIGPSTVVVTLQNGVEAPEQAAAVVGRQRVLPGVVRIFAQLAEPGLVRHVGGPASLVIGGWQAGPSSSAQALQAVFEQCRVSAQASLDVWPQLWEKFLFVVPFGGLGAAVDAPIGRLRSDAGLRGMLVAAMREIADVGRALGVDLAPDVVERSLAFVDEQPATGTSSLQRDVLAGRPSELEAWNGAVARLGRQTGVATPVNRVLYEILRARGGRQAPDVG